MLVLSRSGKLGYKGTRAQVQHALTVLCGLCVVDVRLRLLLVLMLCRRIGGVIGLEGQVLLVDGACKFEEKDNLSD